MHPTRCALRSRRDEWFVVLLVRETAASDHGVTDFGI